MPKSTDSAPIVKKRDWTELDRRHKRRGELTMSLLIDPWCLINRPSG